MKVTPHDHPVFLRNVLFPQIRFERLVDAESPFTFPRLDIKAKRSLGDDGGAIALEISARPDDQDAKNCPLTFSFTALALFECADFSEREKALQEFIHSPSALNLMWPYVRSFLADMNAKLGLPEFHIPLVLDWQEEPESETGTSVDASTDDRQV